MSASAENYREGDQDNTCVYYDQPGHTVVQKPDPAVYGNPAGPDAWPLCPACRAVVNQITVTTPGATS